jgi:hypothetical protein
LTITERGTFLILRLRTGRYAPLPGGVLATRSCPSRGKGASANNLFPTRFAFITLSFSTNHFSAGLATGATM